MNDTHFSLEVRWSRPEIGIGVLSESQNHELFLRNADGSGDVIHIFNSLTSHIYPFLRYNVRLNISISGFFNLRGDFLRSGTVEETFQYSE